MADTPRPAAPSRPSPRRPPERPVHRVVDLVDPARQQLWNASLEEARSRLLAADPRGVLDLAGSFALVARDGERVVLARSLDRPLRTFLAKEASGPLLVVAERIDEIAAFLEGEGYGAQFHPSYTRMVPAHHVTTLRLVGCPDPNPVHERFFDPPRAVLPADLDACGEAYVGALLGELAAWLESVDDDEPIGVAFSGGIDSGAVLVGLEHVLRRSGQSPARLKAFTLSVAQTDGAGSSGAGSLGADAAQAREFLRATDLEMLGEVIEGGPETLDPLAAVEVLEDYKPLDVECAAATLALLAGVRERYPDWRLVVDGDGGDENLKDYPIEINDELTIVSVVSNSMLYQEGWGVGAIKHSPTYSGGLSRACARTAAPLAHHGFVGFSPFTRPAVVAAAEAIPFDALTDGSHEALYGLKGEVVRRGIEIHTGRTLPVFPKRRFQDGVRPPGAPAPERTSAALRRDEERYRRHLLDLHLGSRGSMGSRGDARSPAASPRHGR